MATYKTESPKEEGPFVYDNWRAAIDGVPSTVALEYPLFTDAHIVGEIRSGFGPYRILNTVPITKTRSFVPALVLRAEFHLEDDFFVRKDRKTNIHRYHGGLLNDEIAALLSLCLGIRLKSGGYTREFLADSDPKGRPTATEIYRDPVLPIPAGRSVILPRALGEHSLTDASILGSLPLIPRDGALALVRSTRLYQDAVWITEAERNVSTI